LKQNSKERDNVSLPLEGFRGESGCKKVINIALVFIQVHTTSGANREMDSGDTLLIVESTEEDVNKHAPHMGRGGIPLSNSPLGREEG
jgi:hypothetical protein